MSGDPDLWREYRRRPRITFRDADAIRAARASKPVWAFVAESALSAGYALASQADRIILPRTGEVGSIGVLLVHADFSGRLSDAVAATRPSSSARWSRSGGFTKWWSNPAASA